MFNTNDFVEDLKAYLKQKVVQLDSKFSKLEIYDAYTNEHLPLPPEIDIYIADEYEDESSNSFTEGENISTIMLNIYCYADAMYLESNTEKENAQKTTTYLAQLVKEALTKNNLHSNNSNIISVTKRSYTGAMNTRDTKLYVAIFSYEFKVNNNYVRIDSSNSNSNNEDTNTNNTNEENNN